MNGPHTIAIVSSPDDLGLRDVTVRYSGVLVSDTNLFGKSSLFKCKDYTVSEVFGYLLAKLLRVPVARFQGLRFAGPCVLPGGYRVSPSNLGLLVEYIPSLVHVQLEELAARDKALAARFLTMCFFDRHEWPEVYDGGGSLYAIDLERIGPLMLVDEFTATSKEEVRLRLLCREDEYVQTSCSALSEVLSESDQLDVRKQLELELSLLSQISCETLQQELSIRNHPHAPLLSAFFLAAVCKRQKVLSGRIGTRAWDQGSWENKIGCADPLLQPHGDERADVRRSSHDAAK
jgi:hypothetical protein